MPDQRPSDSNKDRAEWWKDKGAQEPEDETPEDLTADNRDAAKSRALDEEQRPVKFPT